MGGTNSGRREEKVRERGRKIWEGGVERGIIIREEVVQEEEQEQGTTGGSIDQGRATGRAPIV